MVRFHPRQELRPTMGFNFCLLIFVLSFENPSNFFFQNALKCRNYFSP